MEPPGSRRDIEGNKEDSGRELSSDIEEPHDGNKEDINEDPDACPQEAQVGAHHALNDRAKWKERKKMRKDPPATTTLPPTKRTGKAGLAGGFPQGKFRETQDEDELPVVHATPTSDIDSDSVGKKSSDQDEETGTGIVEASVVPEAQYASVLQAPPLSSVSPHEPPAQPTSFLMTKGGKLLCFGIVLVLVIGAVATAVVIVNARDDNPGDPSTSVPTSLEIAATSVPTPGPTDEPTTVSAGQPTSSDIIELTPTPTLVSPTTATPRPVTIPVAARRPTPDPTILSTPDPSQNPTQQPSPAP